MTMDEARLLRDAFGSFLTGVTVVTTRDGQGQPIGFTANSFSSVSLDPPLLLVSIANRSANLAHFAGGAGFAVNILAEDQKAVSNTFARPGADRFAEVGWRAGPAGNPVLSGVAAWFDCTLESAIPAGDHTILLGRVKGFEGGTAPGLGYCRGAYVTPASSALAAEHGPRVVICALIEHEGRVLLVDDGAGGVKLPEARVGSEGAGAALTALIARMGAEATPGMVYAIYDDPVRQIQFIVHLCPAASARATTGAFVAPGDASALADVTDSASRALISRFAQEYRLGQFGQYVGSHEAGDVRPFGKG